MRETRTLTVLGSERISPSRLRTTLGGAGLGSLPTGQAGGYVKLLLPTDGDRPTVRTYTIRAQRADAIDIEFAVHEPAGPALRWALEARPGDPIEVGGPGPAKKVDPTADAVLLAGDLSALPALAVNLERLPAAARGHAVVLVPDAADTEDLVRPAGVELQWIVEPDAGRGGARLLEAVRALPAHDGRTAGWVACEFETMRALRAHLTEDRSLGGSDLYASSYWKRGLAEEDHKRVKRDDRDAAAI